MQWLSCGRWAVALTILVLGASGAAVPAQGVAAGEKVRFDTFDRVTLRGTYYPSSKGTKAACVLLLHQIGGNSGQEGWASLAKTLQEKGFAVLAFDFRGHGESKEVDPTVFWKVGHNSKMKGFNPSKPRSEINHKDFTLPYHYLTLVNDIAAAKRYLDTRNDSQECNSANVIVIGAESGAALGALWMATEWQRSTGPPAAPLVPVASKGKGGQEINCAIWLSMSPNLSSTYRAPIESWLRVQTVKEKNPMYFLYGAQDTKSEQQIQKLLNQTLNSKTDKKLSKLTGSKGIKGTKLAGRDLLNKSLETQDLIVSYLEKVIADNGTNTYERRDVSKQPLYAVPFEAFLK